MNSAGFMEFVFSKSVVSYKTVVHSKLFSLHTSTVIMEVDSPNLYPCGPTTSFLLWINSCQIVGTHSIHQWLKMTTHHSLSHRESMNIWGKTSSVFLFFHLFHNHMVLLCSMFVMVSKPFPLPLPPPSLLHSVLKTILQHINIQKCWEMWVNSFYDIGYFQLIKKNIYSAYGTHWTSQHVQKKHQSSKKSWKVETLNLLTNADSITIALKRKKN